VTTLINSLKTAMLSADGSLFSSLVSPTRGLDAANFRDGNVINYTPEQAKFLFETTFEVNWGPAPGSGEDKVGSFHDVIVPEMVKAFNQPYTLHCMVAQPMRFPGPIRGISIRYISPVQKPTDQWIGIHGRWALSMLTINPISML
jgi:hypothetical protein